MNYNVKEIEFDFDDECYGYDPLTFDEEIAIRDSALGVWEVDNEDDMIDEITTATGYLVKNIYFDIQLEDYSLGNQDDTFIDINNTGGKY